MRKIYTKNKKISLTLPALIKIMARYLDRRVKICCPCGDEKDIYYTKKEIEVHLKHIFYYGIE